MGHGQGLPPVTLADAITASTISSDSAATAKSGPIAISMLPVPHSSFTGTGRPPRVGPNIQVNAPQSFWIGRSETTIAVSDNGNNMVAGWNDADGFCGPPFGAPCPPPPVPGLSGYGFSTDGGQTCTDPGAPPVLPFPSTPGVMTRGDPLLDTGDPGNKTYYYANLAVRVDTGAFGGMTVHTGSFKGKSFGWTSGTVIPPPAPGDFLDKEHIAADKNSRRDNVYVSVTNFLGGVGGGQIEVYSSTDGAVTFGGPGIVQPAEAVAVNQGSQRFGWLSPAHGRGTLRTSSARC